jgi:hypothetical protein
MHVEAELQPLSALGHESGGRALAPVDLSPGTGSFIQLISSRLNIRKLNARIMATDLDRSDSNHSSRLTSEPLEALRHLKVSLDNPETSTNDGLDSERCSALHNGIVKHAWQAEGYDLAKLPTTTWWHRPDYSPRLDELQKLLPASLVEFLKQALTPAADELLDSSRYYFFYLSAGLTIVPHYTRVDAPSLDPSSSCTHTIGLSLLSNTNSR